MKIIMMQSELWKLRFHNFNISKFYQDNIQKLIENNDEFIKKNNDAKQIMKTSFS